jgi:[CysO sulfur-carrier protein]-S-L-cysteine hydrolase
MNLVLAPGVLEAIVRHAQACAPDEGCGLIVGKNGVGERFTPMKNVLGSSAAYEMDPAELIRVLRGARESGDELIAIYHSHPEGPTTPSKTDIDHTHYPEAAQIIVSLERPDSPVVRAFRIIDREALEIEVRAIV